MEKQSSNAPTFQRGAFRFPFRPLGTQPSGARPAAAAVRQPFPFRFPILQQRVPAPIPAAQTCPPAAAPATATAPATTPAAVPVAAVRNGGHPPSKPNVVSQSEGGSPDAEELSLMIEPGAARFSAAAGGCSVHNLGNPADERIAFKVKSSNVADYEVSPLCGFVEGMDSGKLKITRTGGRAPGKDHLEVFVKLAPPDVTDPATLFADGKSSAVVNIDLYAV